MAEQSKEALLRQARSALAVIVQDHRIRQYLEIYDPQALSQAQAAFVALNQSFVPCSAVIWHGPGHQSRSRCSLTGPHEQHFVEGPRNVFYWHGLEGMSTSFDDSPEDRSE